MSSSCKTTLLKCFLLGLASAVFGLFAPSVSNGLVRLKEVPEITFENLSPPYKSYAYFQNCRNFPFVYDATSFSLVNAWWLAEASTLVYADETYAKQQFSKAGFKHIQFFNGISTQCFVAANDRFAIVAFRGSEIWKRQKNFDARRKFADLTTNIDIRLSEWRKGARVHSGFKDALEEVWDALLPEIERLQSQGVRIWITGHSLGAALATLASDQLQDIQGLYTFGSPRVGDEAFKAGFRSGTYRVVNGSDIVAKVPPAGPFRHIGQLIRLDPSGGIQYRSGAIEASRIVPDPDETNTSQDSKDNPKINSADLIPAFVRDHVPLLYTVLLWNELVKTTGDLGAATKNKAR